MQGMGTNPRRLGSFGAVILVLAFCGCNKPSENGKSAGQQTQGVQQTVKENYQQAKSYAFDKKQQFVTAMDKQFNEIGEGIGTLEKHADQAGEQMKGTYNGLIRNLKEKQNAAREKLDELQDASADNWDKMKNESEDAMKELKEAYRETKSRLSGS